LTATLLEHERLEATAVNGYLRDMAFRAPIHLRLARRLESTGRRMEARAVYARVVELGRDGDREVLSGRDEATAGMARIRR
jgi:hypothetical protein